MEHLLVIGNGMAGLRCVEEVLQQSGFWTSVGPFSHIVLSSRVRLARNMVSVPFPGRLHADELYRLSASE